MVRAVEGQEPIEKGGMEATEIVIGCSVMLATIIHKEDRTPLRLPGRR